MSFLLDPLPSLYLSMRSECFTWAFLLINCTVFTWACTVLLGQWMLAGCFISAFIELCLVEYVCWHLLVNQWIHGIEETFVIHVFAFCISESQAFCCPVNSMKKTCWQNGFTQDMSPHSVILQGTPTLCTSPRCHPMPCYSINMFTCSNKYRNKSIIMSPSLSLASSYSCDGWVWTSPLCEECELSSQKVWPWACT